MVFFHSFFFFFHSFLPISFLSLFCSYLFWNFFFIYASIQDLNAKYNFKCISFITFIHYYIKYFYQKKKFIVYSYIIYEKNFFIRLFIPFQKKKNQAKILNIFKYWFFIWNSTSPYSCLAFHWYFFDIFIFQIILLHFSSKIDSNSFELFFYLKRISSLLLKWTRFQHIEFILYWILMKIFLFYTRINESYSWFLYFLWLCFAFSLQLYMILSHLIVISVIFLSFYMILIFSLILS